MPTALDLLYAAAAIATAPWWIRTRREGWRERFGHIPALPAPAPGHSPRPRILLHAVSVGEVSALRDTVPRLAEHADVVVSATTDTGLARARELYARQAHVVRYPLDFSGAVRRFLDAVRPDAVGLVELEVWPQFVRACRARAIPVAVVNGRLSERSLKGYRRIRRWIAPVFADLALVAAQDEDYAARFLELGVPPGRCVVTGSVKWDAARIADEVPGAGDLARALGVDRARPLIVAGSTGPGEEAMLHEACPPGVQLLCAPRKPERFDEAAAALPGCRRRSAGALAPPAGTPPPDRFLLDTIGELRAAYALADVAVVGRSFGAQYGSDPIEPVALGRATVIGPAVADFARIVGALRDAGGLVQTTVPELPGVLAALVADPAARRAMAERGRACIRGAQGASTRNTERLLALAVERRGRQGGAGDRTTPAPAKAGAAPAPPAAGGARQASAAPPTPETSAQPLA